MNKTHVRPARDLRNNYAELSKIIKDQHDHIVITNRGRGDTVLNDFEDYARYEEYLHQKYIETKLEEAVREAQSPDAVWVSGKDVLRQAGEYLAKQKSADGH